MSSILTDQFIVAAQLHRIRGPQADVLPGLEQLQTLKMVSHTSSGFLDLPKGVKSRIYRQVFRCTTIQAHVMRFTDVSFDNAYVHSTMARDCEVRRHISVEQRRCISILLVCREIYRESCMLFLTETVVYVGTCVCWKGLRSKWQTCAIPAFQNIIHVPAPSNNRAHDLVRLLAMQKKNGVNKTIQ